MNIFESDGIDLIKSVLQGQGDVVVVDSEAFIGDLLHCFDIDYVSVTYPLQDF